MAGLIGGSSSKTLRVQEFRSSGTFTVPSGVKTVRLFLVGGGGGAAAGYLAQGGNLVEVNYDVNGKASCSVVIGAGGAVGSPGGNTTFDGVVIAKGGCEQGVLASGSVTPQLGEAGRCGFGGHGADGTRIAPANGAYGQATGPANTGAGGGPSAPGGSGYLRVEWEE